MSRPRLAFVVQRCAPGVRGGAEALCLTLAQHLSEAFAVEILTTCATDYTSWANVLEPGLDEVEGVTVRRFPVAKIREQDSFAALCGIYERHPGQVAASDAEEWMRLQGPLCPALTEFLQANHGDYVAVCGTTYLYWTTWAGLMAVPRGKRVLVPTAHDEWPIHLPHWDDWFAQVDRLVCLTPEEARFLAQRFGPPARPPVIAAMGVDPPPRTDAAGFRTAHGLERPYLLYVGRIDRNKGTPDLVRDYAQIRSRLPEAPDLVLLGGGDEPLAEVPGVHRLGPCDEATKWNALAGCLALINPSPLESLSIVLLEAWSLGRPTLVNAHCEVTVGQSRRSGCGLWYRDCHELRAAIELLAQQPALAAAGPAWVADNYRWQVIVDRYRAVIASLA